MSGDFVNRQDQPYALSVSDTASAIPLGILGTRIGQLWKQCCRFPARLRKHSVPVPGQPNQRRGVCRCRHCRPAGQHSRPGRRDGWGGFRCRHRRIRAPEGLPLRVRCPPACGRALVGGRARLRTETGVLYSIPSDLRSRDLLEARKFGRSDTDGPGTQSNRSGTRNYGIDIDRGLDAPPGGLVPLSEVTPRALGGIMPFYVAINGRGSPAGRPHSSLTGGT